MDKVKVFFTAVASCIMSVLGILAIPVLMLVGCNIIDYATGLMASKYRGQVLDSYKGFRGIAKKICMWLLIVVGAIVDWLLKYATDTIGITLPFTFLVACIVAIWLICNELLSILENIADIGVKLPTFLTKAVKYVKRQVETKADFTTNEEESPDERSI